MLTTSDIQDKDLQDSNEQLSDGYFIYRTGIIDNCANSIITINKLSIVDNLINAENSIQIGDKIYISNTTNSDGYYTVNEILNNTQFQVLETILDFTSGNINYIYPSGASRIGFDNTKTVNIASKNMQGALENLYNLIDNQGPSSNNCSIFSIWAEESQNLSNNNYQWSFGDGGITPGSSGIVIPFSCECIAMSFSCMYSGTYSINMHVNSNPLGAFINIISNNKAYNVFATPISIGAGSVINFLTSSAIGTSGPARIVAYFRANVETISRSNEIIIRKNSGVNIGTKSRLNLIEGSNISLNVVNDDTEQEIDINIASVMTFAKENTLIGKRYKLNLLDSPSVLISLIDDPVNNKIDLSLNTNIQNLIINKNSSLIGQQPKLNLIEGSNISLDVINDTTNNQINCTINTTTPTIPKRLTTVQFVLPESISKVQRWYYVNNWPGVANNKARSGNSAGLLSAGNCVPFIVPFNGKIIKYTCILKSSGTSKTTVVYPVNFTNQLQLVSFSNITTLTDIVISIPNTYLVGTNALANSNFTGIFTCEINVNEGDMLALKFINGNSSSDIGIIMNTYFSFVIEEI